MYFSDFEASLCYLLLVIITNCGKEMHKHL